MSEFSRKKSFLFSVYDRHFYTIYLRYQSFYTQVIMLFGEIGTHFFLQAFAFTDINNCTVFIKYL